MTNALLKMGNGLIDFFSWFFSDFIGTINNFLFDTSLSGAINQMIDGINKSTHIMGPDFVTGTPIVAISHIEATNLVIIVSLIIFLGVGVAIFFIVKNILFNWA